MIKEKVSSKTAYLLSLHALITAATLIKEKLFQINENKVHLPASINCTSEMRPHTYTHIPIHTYR